MRQSVPACAKGFWYSVNKETPAKDFRTNGCTPALAFVGGYPGLADLSIGDIYRVILYKTTEALHFSIGDPERYGSGSMSDIV